MTKTLIRHAVSADFQTLLEIDEASFPPGVAYDSTELSYFMNRSRSRDDCRSKPTAKSLHS